MYFNSLLRPREAYTHQQTRPSLVQIMACCLFSAKPLSELMLDHRFSQKWQLSVCKWNFKVYKLPLLMKIPIKMKELRWFYGAKLAQLPLQNTGAQVAGWYYVLDYCQLDPFRRYFSEILIKIQQFSFKKMRFNMASKKWHPFQGLLWDVAVFFFKCHFQTLCKAWNIIKNSICEIPLSFLPASLIDDKSTLVIAWCHQATSHKLNQCWLISMSLQC